MMSYEDEAARAWIREFAARHGKAGMDETARRLGQIAGD